MKIDTVELPVKVTLDVDFDQTSFMKSLEEVYLLANKKVPLRKRLIVKIYCMAIKCILGKK